MPESPRSTVLHYTGYDEDRGGVIRVVCALAEAGRFACIHGVNPGFKQHRRPPLPVLELPAVRGEQLDLRALWRARTVAKAARTWLRGGPERVFHGHSRPGLAVALWLAAWGERRVVVSVHCYGRRRWFYRWARRRLGRRLFWLSPAMKRYYGLADGETWAQCIPGCIPKLDTRPARAPAADGRIRLGGVGMLVPWKGWHLVLEALAALAPEVRARISFCHLGGDDGSVESQLYARELRAQTTALGLVGMVSWLGEQPSAGPFLGETDCLLIVSRGEPFSLAMLEALQAGVPVLAADSGGAADIIRPGHNGWLFHSGQPDTLARVIGVLVESAALARVRVDPAETDRFTAPVVAAQWEQVYAGLSGVE